MHLGRDTTWGENNNQSLQVPVLILLRFVCIPVSKPKTPFRVAIQSQRYRKLWNRGYEMNLAQYRFNSGVAPDHNNSLSAAVSKALHRANRDWIGWAYCQDGWGGFDFQGLCTSSSKEKWWTKFRPDFNENPKHDHACLAEFLLNQRYHIKHSRELIVCGQMNQNFKWKQGIFSSMLVVLVTAKVPNGEADPHVSLSNTLGAKTSPKHHLSSSISSSVIPRPVRTWMWPYFVVCLYSQTDSCKIESIRKYHVKLKSLQ